MSAWLRIFLAAKLKSAGKKRCVRQEAMYLLQSSRKSTVAVAIAHTIHAIMDQLDNSAYCIAITLYKHMDLHMGHGWAQAPSYIHILQAINVLHQKRVWPHET